MKTKEEIETIKKELSKEDFLALNQTERDVYLNKDKKQPKYEFRVVNRWKQYTAYRIELAPSIFVVKQLKCKVINIDWLGFCFSIQRNFLETTVSINSLNKQD